jgi:hypothetical protein
LIQDDQDAPANIKRKLEKRGLDAAAIDEAMAKFDRAPLDTRVPLGGGIEIIRRQGHGLAPALDGPLLDNRVLLKIAYEFLALHVREEIYSQAPELAELRAAVWDGLLRSDDYEIAYQRTAAYSPVHGLVVAGQPDVEVVICLFDWLRFRVRFKKLVAPSRRLAYEHRLDTGAEVLGSPDGEGPAA